MDFFLISYLPVTKADHFNDFVKCELKLNANALCVKVEYVRTTKTYRAHRRWTADRVHKMLIVKLHCRVLKKENENIPRANKWEFYFRWFDVNWIEWDGSPSLTCSTDCIIVEKSLSKRTNEYFTIISYRNATFSYRSILQVVSHFPCVDALWRRFGKS